MQQVRTRTAGKKSKRPNKSPSRLRYWASRRLEKHKVKNLMRHCGMTRAKAEIYWVEHRLGRVPDGFLRKIA